MDTSDLGLKVLQRNSGENGVLVNNRGIVDLLVDGDGGVNVGVLDGLLWKGEGAKGVNKAIVNATVHDY